MMTLAFTHDGVLRRPFRPFAALAGYVLAAAIGIAAGNDAR